MKNAIAFILWAILSPVTLLSGEPDLELYFLVPSEQTVETLRRHVDDWIDFSTSIRTDSLRGDSLSILLQIEDRRVSSIDYSMTTFSVLAKELGRGLKRHVLWDHKSQPYSVRLDFAVKKHEDVYLDPDLDPMSDEILIALIQLWPDDLDTTTKTPEPVNSADSIISEPEFDYDDLRDAMRYPDAAQRLGIEDSLMTELLLDTNGRVKRLVLAEGKEPMFIAQICRRVVGIKFTPARSRTKPISTWVRIPFKFVLR